VAKGAFRRDLLFRLNTVELRLPSLRERQEDIVPMARCFLDRAAARYGKAELRLGAGAERALLSYAWPGNVRELQHVIERAVLMSTGHGSVDLDLSLGPGAPAQAAGATGTGNGATIDSLTLDAAEELLVKRALEHHAGNIQRAAEALGVSRAALYRRLEKFGIRTESAD
jgi:DNA-binding NtrC family response regulator